MELALRVRIDVDAWFVLWGYRAGYIVGIECSGTQMFVESFICGLGKLSSLRRPHWAKMASGAASGAASGRRALSLAKPKDYWSGQNMQMHRYGQNSSG